MRIVKASERSGDYSPKPATPAPIDLVVPAACAGLRLDQALARLLPEFSRSRIAAWVRGARVTVDGRTVAARSKVYGGENVHLVPEIDARTLAFRPEQIPLNIVHEDAALIVIDKPPGLVVHPGSGNWHGTMLNALLEHAPALAHVPRAGIVHRLDKDTSGLLVVAKTLASHAELVRQLQARSVLRAYIAVVHGRVARDGSVDAPIGRHPAARTKMAVVARGKPAVTHYQVLERFSRASLLRCRLETGRTHQIRVHLASVGHPLVGDPVYGRKAADFGFERQALHAEELGFIHPATHETVAWQAEPPADMQKLMDALRETHD